MFHAEIREGTQVVREFNLDERRLWVRYLAPLMSDKDFTLEEHEWTPRQTRITILEGAELRPHEISMGRGWPNARRVSTDVTKPVLARARELYQSSSPGVAAGQAAPAPNLVMGATDGQAGPGANLVGGATDAGQPAPGARILQERLIGRLGAGPVTAAQIEALAQSAMPGAEPSARRAACERAVWDLLAAGEAQLAANDT